MAEIEHATNVLDIAVVIDQTAPPRFNAQRLRRHSSKPFPGVAFDHVVVFTDWKDTGITKSFNAPSPPVFGALTIEGTFSPLTVLPGVSVEMDKVAELLDLVNRQPPNATLVPATCSASPGFRHSYVFYDATKSPVAVLVVSLGDRDWWSYPDIGHNRGGCGRPAPEFGDRYLALCESIGAGLCFYHDDDYLKRLFAAVQAKPKPSPLTVVPDGYLDELGSRDRRVVCAWAHQRIFRLPTFGGSDFGLRALDGTEEWVGRTLAWYECVRERFACHRKLSEVLPCEERALAGDPGFFAPDAHECRGQAECIWGFKVTRAPWLARP